MTTESLEQVPEKVVTPARKGKVGPKSKATPERVAKLCEHIANGQTLQSASRMVGVNPSTIYDWMNASPEIANAIEEAEGKAEQVLIDLAIQGAKKDGRIALMMLERRYSHWRKREEHAHVHATPQILKELVDSRKERDRKLLAEQSVIDV